MKAIIITRAIDENPESKKIRALVNNCETLKIAVNSVNCKANIRIFLDLFEIKNNKWDKTKPIWKNYLKFTEQLMTISNGLIEIPQKYHEKFIFFNITKKPCTENNTELFCYPSSMGAAIDLAYKIGVTDLLLIANNNIVEDGVAFKKGYCNDAKKMTDFYNTKMKLFQFSEGNFNLPVKTVEQFIKKGE